MKVHKDVITVVFTSYRSQHIWGIAPVCMWGIYPSSLCLQEISRCSSYHVCVCFQLWRGRCRCVRAERSWSSEECWRRSLRKVLVTSDHVFIDTVLSSSNYVARIYKIKESDILPPNSVVPPKPLWVQQSGCRATRWLKQRCVCYFVTYNSFERGSTNQSQGPEPSDLNVTCTLHYFFISAAEIVTM